MSKLNYAGEYAISELKLMSSSGNVVDLSMAYTALSLFEDIFSSLLFKFELVVFILEVSSALSSL